MQIFPQKACLSWKAKKHLIQNIPTGGLLLELHLAYFITPNLCLAKTHGKPAGSGIGCIPARTLRRTTSRRGRVSLRIVCLGGWLGAWGFQGFQLGLKRGSLHLTLYSKVVAQSAPAANWGLVCLSPAHHNDTRD